MSQKSATNSTREILFAGNSRAVYAHGTLLPASIRYADGLSLEITYDTDLWPTRLSESTGTVWTRMSELDGEHFALWERGDGLKQRQAIGVLPNGTVQRLDDGGHARTVLPDGKCLLGYKFPAGFDLAEELSILFPAVDNNLDKALTNSELQRAVSMRWSGAGRSMLALVLRAAFAQIISLRNDAMMQDAGGLGLTEILRHADYADRAVLSDACESFGQFELIFAQLFDAIDSDQDTMICLTDAQPLLLSGEMDDNQAQLLDHLLRFADCVESFELFGFHDLSDWINKQDFLQFSQAFYKWFVAGQLLPCGFLLDQCSQRAGRAAAPLYNGEPADSCVLAAVEQGPLGSAYFQAVVAGLVATNPQMVLNMISEEGSGVSVRFPGLAQAPVPLEVPAPLDAGLFARGVKYGAWLAILDKAYSAVRDQQSDAVQLLSNRPGTWQRLASLSEEELGTRLTDNFRQRRIVLVSTGEGASEADKAFYFAITRFGRENGQVTVWNHSWSSVSMKCFQGIDPTGQNAFSMHFGELRRRFVSIYLG